MPNYFSAREILAESFRNRRSRRIPFTAGQCFGLTITEDLSDACLLRSDIVGAAEGAPASAASRPIAPAQG